MVWGEERFDDVFSIRWFQFRVQHLQKKVEINLELKKKNYPRLAYDISINVHFTHIFSKFTVCTTKLAKGTNHF